MRLVEISGLPSSLSGNQLTFLLPGSSDTIYAKGLYYQKNSDTTYTWWGEIADHKGYVGIASNVGGKVVQISLEEKTYFLHPLSARYNAQVEFKPDTLIEQEPETETPHDITTDPNCEIDTCKAIANVLVLVTPEAKDEIMERYQNLTSQQQSLFSSLYLSLGILTLNFALLNSGITGKTARFVVEEFDDFNYDPQAIITNDVDNLIDNSAAGDRFLANRADMLILLTDSRYGTYSGAASLSYPVAIVEANYIGGPTYTFAHEVGHLLGARHNRKSNEGDEPDGPGCVYGYRFLLAGILTRYTIMAKMLEANAVRILSYSNPRIVILGTPIGTAGSDNTSHISETFCAVANNHQDDELEANILGPLLITCPQSATYAIDIDPPGNGIPGNPPYYISWMMGESPYTNYQSSGATFLGSSSSVTINSENINYDKFWLLAHVVSSDGVIANDLIEVEIEPCEHPKVLTQVDNFEGRLPLLSVFPNPAENYLILSNVQPEKHIQGSYFITNALGQILSAGNLSWENKNQQTEIRFNLVSGLYTLHVQTETTFASYKFMVQY